jgi:hypothetical protein
MEKYQLKKDVDLKRTVTVNGKKVESPNHLTIAADAKDDVTRDAEEDQLSSKRKRGDDCAGSKKKSRKSK